MEEVDQVNYLLRGNGGAPTRGGGRYAQRASVVMIYGRSRRAVTLSAVISGD
jgi:hypothetical protein